VDFIDNHCADAGTVVESDSDGLLGAFACPRRK
jgi:hypothetical protein